MVASRKPARTAARVHGLSSGQAGLKNVFARDFSRRLQKLKRLVAISPDHLTVDDVHDMRVTTRRLRASLSILRQVTTVKKSGAVRRDLRALGRVLGERRMLDIAIRDAKRYRLDATVLDKRYARAGKTVERALARKRTSSLIDQLADVATAIPQTAFERLTWRLQDFEWDLAYLLQHPPRNAEERHELRIQLKKVRYTLEALGREVPVLARLQDHLGREHDLGVLQILTTKKREVARDERKARERAKRALAPALRASLRRLQALRRELVR
jgi:CHAD domain-containing protein